METTSPISRDNLIRSSGGIPPRSWPADSSRHRSSESPHEPRKYLPPFTTCLDNIGVGQVQPEKRQWYNHFRLDRGVERSDRDMPSAPSHRRRFKVRPQASLSKTSTNLTPLGGREPHENFDQIRLSDNFFRQGTTAYILVVFKRYLQTSTPGNGVTGRFSGEDKPLPRLQVLR